MVIPVLQAENPYKQDWMHDFIASGVIK